ncbi:hypothetical protein F4803DRAFT_570362 [Xylaria telfairii]|nr:hypothetical protein F4803DRAFT_570362 [Xylaria telfairii]
MAAFHPFPRLPAELRAQIWEMTVAPRIVEVRITYRASPLSSDSSSTNTATVPHLMSLTPVPEILQTCQEARNQGLYQQAFSELAAPDGEGLRYVWLNLEIDIISIGTTIFAALEPVALLIQRLRLERENSDESFFHFESNDLGIFVNVKEIHVVCADGLRAWNNAPDAHYWPCARENLFFIDPDNGNMMGSDELEAMYDETLAEGYRREELEVAASWAEYGYHYPSGERIA